jgi:hypothetical protein
MDNAIHLKCACGNCGEIIKYLPGAAGQTVECPKCKQRSQLPVLSPAEPLDIPRGSLPKCPDCGAPLDPHDITCAACDRRRAKFALLWGLGSALALLAVGFVALAALNQPLHTKPPPAPPKPPATTILAQPVPPPPKSLNDLRVGKFYLQQQRGSPLILAVGEVLNVSQNLHYHVRVNLDLFDAKGTRIGAVTDVNNLIRPGDRWRVLAKVADSRAVAVRLAGIREEP